MELDFSRAALSSRTCFLASALKIFEASFVSLAASKSERNMESSGMVLEWG